MSPYPLKYEAAVDFDVSGKEVTLPKGLSLPDMAKIFYGPVKITPIALGKPFMQRDMFKDSEYVPGKHDPFVFKNWASVSAAKEMMRSHQNHLMERAALYNLPIKRDPVRMIPTIDSDSLIQKLEGIPDPSRSNVAVLVGNEDIAKKYCIVRAYPAGWWAVSYSGKDSPQPEYFREALDATKQVIKMQRNHPKFAALKAKYAKEAGDPRYSNVGYPFFNAEKDKTGKPISKYKVMDLYEGMGYQGFNMDNLLKEIDARCPELALKGFPLAIAAIRRGQPNYKQLKLFSYASGGLRLATGVRGLNTVRVAYMAPYIYNLYITPIALEWKILRLITPGLFHDGPTMDERLKYLSSHKRYTIEADYSNYDRFIPQNVMSEFIKGYASSLSHPQFVEDLLMFPFKKMPIIWPDSVGGDGRHGIVINSQSNGLFSGLKTTGDYGTAANNIVVGAGFINNKIMSKTEWIDYQMGYLNGSVKPGQEEYWIQSDDTQLFDSSIPGLVKKNNAFKEAVSAAGLKGSITASDRFLMRHISDGRDSPLVTRIFQNTVSPEVPVTNPLIFTVGFMMRTEGLLGVKVFGPRANVPTPVPSEELFFTKIMLTDLRKLLTESAIPITDVISFIDSLLVLANQLIARIGDKLHVTPGPDIFKPIKNMKMAVLIKLAEFETEALKSGKVDQSMLYALLRDSHSPSSKLLLDTIISSNHEFEHILEEMGKVDNALMLTAYKMIGLKLDINQW